MPIVVSDEQINSLQEISEDTPTGSLFDDEPEVKIDDFNKLVANELTSEDFPIGSLLDELDEKPSEKFLSNQICSQDLLIGSLLDVEPKANNIDFIELPNLTQTIIEKSNNDETTNNESEIKVNNSNEQLLNNKSDVFETLPIGLQLDNAVEVKPSTIVCQTEYDSQPLESVQLKNDKSIFKPITSKKMSKKNKRKNKQKELNETEMFNTEPFIKNLLPETNEQFFNESSVEQIVLEDLPIEPLFDDEPRKEFNDIKELPSLMQVSAENSIIKSLFDDNSEMKLNILNDMTTSTSINKTEFQEIVNETNQMQESIDDLPIGSLFDDESQLEVIKTGNGRPTSSLLTSNGKINSDLIVDLENVEQQQKLEKETSHKQNKKRKESRKSRKEKSSDEVVNTSSLKLESKLDDSLLVFDQTSLIKHDIIETNIASKGKCHLITNVNVILTIFNVVVIESISNIENVILNQKSNEDEACIVRDAETLEQITNISETQNEYKQLESHHEIDGCWSIISKDGQSSEQQSKLKSSLELNEIESKQLKFEKDSQYQVIGDSIEKISEFDLLTKKSKSKKSKKSKKTKWESIQLDDIESQLISESGDPILVDEINALIVNNKSSNTDEIELLETSTEEFHKISNESNCDIQFDKTDIIDWPDLVQSNPETNQLNVIKDGTEIEPSSAIDWPNETVVLIDEPTMNPDLNQPKSNENDLDSFETIQQNHTTSITDEMVSNCDSTIPQIVVETNNEQPVQSTLHFDDNPNNSLLTTDYDDSDYDDSQSLNDGESSIGGGLRRWRHRHRQSSKNRNDRRRRHEKSIERTRSTSKDSNSSCVIENKPDDVVESNEKTIEIINNKVSSNDNIEPHSACCVNDLVELDMKEQFKDKAEQTDNLDTIQPGTHVLNLDNNQSGTGSQYDECHNKQSKKNKKKNKKQIKAENIPKLFNINEQVGVDVSIVHNLDLNPIKELAPMSNASILPLNQTKPMPEQLTHEHDDIIVHFSSDQLESVINDAISEEVADESGLLDEDVETLAEKNLNKNADDFIDQEILGQLEDKVEQIEYQIETLISDVDLLRMTWENVEKQFANESNEKLVCAADDRPSTLHEQADVSYELIHINEPYYLQFDSIPTLFSEDDHSSCSTVDNSITLNVENSWNIDSDESSNFKKKKRNSRNKKSHKQKKDIKKMRDEMMIKSNSSKRLENSFHQSTISPIDSVIVDNLRLSQEVDQKFDVDQNADELIQELYSETINSDDDEKLKTVGVNVISKNNNINCEIEQNQQPEDDVCSFNLNPINSTIQTIGDSTFISDNLTNETTKATIESILDQPTSPIIVESESDYITIRESEKIKSKRKKRNRRKKKFDPSCNVHETLNSNENNAERFFNSYRTEIERSSASLSLLQQLNRDSKLETKFNKANQPGRYFPTSTMSSMGDRTSSLPDTNRNIFNSIFINEDSFSEPNIPLDVVNQNVMEQVRSAYGDSIESNTTKIESNLTVSTTTTPTTTGVLEMESISFYSIDNHQPIDDEPLTQRQSNVHSSDKVTNTKSMIEQHANVDPIDQITNLSENDALRNMASTTIESTAAATAIQLSLSERDVNHKIESTKEKAEEEEEEKEEGPIVVYSKTFQLNETDSNIKESDVDENASKLGDVDDMQTFSPKINANNNETIIGPHLLNKTDEQTLVEIDQIDNGCHKHSFAKHEINIEPDDKIVSNENVIAITTGANNNNNDNNDLMNRILQNDTNISSNRKKRRAKRKCTSSTMIMENVAHTISMLENDQNLLSKPIDLIVKHQQNQQQQQQQQFIEMEMSNSKKNIDRMLQSRDILVEQSNMEQQLRQQTDDKLTLVADLPIACQFKTTTSADVVNAVPISSCLDSLQFQTTHPIEICDDVDDVAAPTVLDNWLPSTKEDSAVIRLNEIECYHSDSRRLDDKFKLNDDGAMATTTAEAYKTATAATEEIANRSKTEQYGRTVDNDKIDSIDYRSERQESAELKPKVYENVFELSQLDNGTISNEKRNNNNGIDEWKKQQQQQQQTQQQGELVRIESTIGDDIVIGISQHFETSTRLNDVIDGNDGETVSEQSFVPTDEQQHESLSMVGTIAAQVEWQKEIRIETDSNVEQPKLSRNMKLDNLNLEMGPHYLEPTHEPSSNDSKHLRRYITTTEELKRKRNRKKCKPTYRRNNWNQFDVPEMSTTTTTTTIASDFGDNEVDNEELPCLIDHESHYSLLPQQLQQQQPTSIVLDYISETIQHSSKPKTSGENTIDDGCTQSNLHTNTNVDNKSINLTSCIVTGSMENQMTQLESQLDGNGNMDSNVGLVMNKIYSKGKMAGEGPFPNDLVNHMYHVHNSATNADEFEANSERHVTTVIHNENDKSLMIINCSQMNLLPNNIDNDDNGNRDNSIDSEVYCQQNQHEQPLSSTIDDNDKNETEQHDNSGCAIKPWNNLLQNTIVVQPTSDNNLNLEASKNIQPSNLMEEATNEIQSATQINSTVVEASVDNKPDISKCLPYHNYDDRVVEGKEIVQQPKTTTTTTINESSNDIVSSVQRRTSEMIQTEAVIENVQILTDVGLNHQQQDILNHQHEIIDSSAMIPKPSSSTSSSLEQNVESESTTPSSSNQRSLLNRVARYSIPFHLIGLAFVGFMYMWPRDEFEFNCLLRNEYAQAIMKVFPNGPPPQ